MLALELHNLVYTKEVTGRVSTLSSPLFENAGLEKAGPSSMSELTHKTNRKCNNSI